MPSFFPCLKIRKKSKKNSSEHVMLPIRAPPTDETFEWNGIKEFQKESWEIINNVTVASDVFETIERIEAIERGADTQKDHSKSEEGLGKKEENKINDSVMETGDTTDKINSVSKTNFEKDNLEKSRGILQVQNEMNLRGDLPNEGHIEIERDDEMSIIVHRTESQAFRVGIDPEIDRNTELNNSDIESQTDSKDQYEKNEHDVNRLSGDSQWTDKSDTSSESEFLLSESKTVCDKELATKNSSFETSEMNAEKTEACKIDENSKFLSGDINLENDYCKSNLMDTPMRDSCDSKKVPLSGEFKITFNKNNDSCIHNSISQELFNSRKNSGDAKNHLKLHQKCAVSALSEFGDVGTLDCTDHSPEMLEMSFKSSFLSHCPIESDSKVLTATNTIETIETNTDETENCEIIKNTKFEVDDSNLETNHCSSVDVSMKESSDFKKTSPTNEIDITFGNMSDCCENKTISPEMLNSRINSSGFQKLQLDNQKCGISTLNEFEDADTLDRSDNFQRTWTNVSEMSSESDVLLSANGNQGFNSNGTLETSGTNTEKVGDRNRDKNLKFPLVDVNSENCNSMNIPMEGPSVWNSKHKYKADEIGLANPSLSINKQGNKFLSNYEEVGDSVKFNKTVLKERKIKQLMNENLKTGENHALLYPNDDVYTSSDDGTNIKCFENAYVLGCKSNHNISNVMNIHFDDQYQKLRPQEVSGFGELRRYSDCEKLNDFADDSEEDIRETGVLNGLAEYSSNDTEDKSLTEESGDEENYRSFRHPAYGNSVKKETPLFQGSLRPEKESSNVIDFHKGIITDNRGVYNHIPEGTVNKNISQNRCVEVSKYSNNELNYDNTSNANDISDKIHVSTSDKSIDMEMRGLLEKCNSKTGERRVEKTKSLKKVKNIVDNRKFLDGERNRENASCTNAKNTRLSGSKRIAKTKSRSALKIRISKSNSQQRRGGANMDNTYSIPKRTMFVWNGSSHSKILPLQKNTNDSIIIKDKIHKQKPYSSKIPSIEGTCNMDDSLKANDSNEIETIRRQSIERFNRKKVRALSDMGSDLRRIPIEEITRNACKVEDFSLGKRDQVHTLPKIPELNKEENNSNNLPSFQGAHIEGVIANTSPKRIISDTDHQTFFSESDVESYVSEFSGKMTPDRKRILIASRAIRSPKHPYRDIKKSSQNTMLYHRRPVVIKPPKLNLVAYLTKDEHNNVHLKKGYRVRNLDTQKINPTEINKDRDYFTRHPLPQNPTNGATSPIGQKMKFGDAFKKYASKGRLNGNLISYLRSTEWLRDAGVIGKSLSSEEANAVFKRAAGTMVTLNKDEYENFLWKLARVKKMSYNDIHEKLSLVPPECAEMNNS